VQQARLFLICSVSVLAALLERMRVFLVSNNIIFLGPKVIEKTVYYTQGKRMIDVCLVAWSQNCVKCRIACEWKMWERLGGGEVENAKKLIGIENTGKHFLPIPQPDPRLHSQYIPCHIYSLSPVAR